SALLKESSLFVSEFEEAMDDDFNTADAISSIFELVRFINSNVNENSSKEFITGLTAKLEGLCNVLGIEYKKQGQAGGEPAIEALIEERAQAKKNKDFNKADGIRNKLLEMGVVIEDTRMGTRWSYKGKQ
ncbi:MAG: cysteine--tRNA ligase, partial [Clostridiales bacterium]|nr:cysteine--tRNA ligase [Clostridiales bacterium]